jgi:Uncharacterized conserved protein
MKELDVLLARFMEHQYASLVPAEQAAFETLLKYPDPVLLDWVMGHEPLPEGKLGHVIEKIRGTALS